MEKEEKVVVVLILMALSSLSIAYLCFAPSLSEDGKPLTGEVQELTAESEIGDRVSFEAEVLSKRTTYKGDHLLLKVDHDSEVFTVFVPANMGANAVDEAVNVGNCVAITGTLEEYEGEQEIKIINKKDIMVLSDS